MPATVSGETALTVVRGDDDRQGDRAAGLLRDTDTPLAQIAQEVGYSTDHALSKAFAGARGRAARCLPPPHARRAELT